MRWRFFVADGRIFYTLGYFHPQLETNATLSMERMIVNTWLLIEYWQVAFCWLKNYPTIRNKVKEEEDSNLH